MGSSFCLIKGKRRGQGTVRVTVFGGVSLATVTRVTTNQKKRRARESIHLHRTLEQDLLFQLSIEYQRLQVAMSRLERERPSPLSEPSDPLWGLGA